MLSSNFSDRSCVSLIGVWLSSTTQRQSTMFGWRLVILRVQNCLSTSKSTTTVLTCGATGVCLPLWYFVSPIYCNLSLSYRRSTAIDFPQRTLLPWTRQLRSTCQDYESVRNRRTICIYRQVPHTSRPAVR